MVSAATVVGSAYAYSTSITSNGNITGSYITVDTLDSGSSEVSLGKVLSDAAGNYEANAGSGHHIRIESDKSEKAYLYGYFSIEAGGYSGILVKEITFTFEDYDTKMVLTRDSYSSAYGGVPLPLSESDGVRSCDLEIKSIVVSYYETDFDPNGNIKVNAPTVGNISFPKDASTLSVSDGKSLEGLRIVFHVSSESVLG